MQGWKKFWQANPWFPVLLAWYPILLFYQVNIREVVPHDLVEPLAIATLVSVGLLVALRLVWRDWGRAAIWLSVLVVIFFSHGQLLNVLGPNYRVFGRSWPTDYSLLVVWLVLLAGVSLVLWRQYRWDRLLAPLASLSTVLVALVVGQIGWHYLQASGAEASLIDQASAQVEAATPTPAPTKSAAAQAKPDVYYLVFDKHASAKTMKDYYGYDEQPFTDWLQQHGFYVAQDSHTNYPKTSFSLSSSLNMDYLSALLPAVAATAPESSTVDTLFGHNKVGSYLQAQGYTYYNFGSWFEPTQKIAEANVNVEPGKGDFFQDDSFTSKLLSTTMYPTLFKLSHPDAPSFAWIDQHRQWADYQYEKAPEVIHEPGPKFVLAHILQPHNPFVFDQNCQPISEDLYNQAAIPYYVHQVQCTDQHIEDIIGQILASSTTPPIIILQADEGPEAMAYPLPNAYTFKQAGLGSIQERTQILNAYYFPDRQYNDLSQSITPVNSFRIVFNQYFGGQFPLLPDKTFVFADQKHLFDLTDVTEEVNNKP